MSLKCEKKILSLEDLEERLGRRNPGQKVAHCHGCYDLIHPGHIFHFEFARQFGDILLVSLNADQFFVNKGLGRPLLNERFRAISIASLEVVDYVCVYPGFIPEKIFDTVKPDIYVKGAEYAVGPDKPKIPEEAMVSKYGGKVVYGPSDVVYSSSRFIEALLACRPTG